MFCILKAIWFQVSTTTANERKHLKMGIMTVLESCNTILDRTGAPGLAGTSISNFCDIERQPGTRCITWLNTSCLISIHPIHPLLDLQYSQQYILQFFNTSLDTSWHDSSTSFNTSYYILPWKQYIRYILQYTWIHLAIFQYIRCIGRCIRCINIQYILWYISVLHPPNFLIHPNTSSMYWDVLDVNTSSIHPWRFANGRAALVYEKHSCLVNFMYLYVLVRTFQEILYWYVLVCTGMYRYVPVPWHTILPDRVQVSV